MPDFKQRQIMLDLTLWCSFLYVLTEDKCLSSHAPEVHVLSEP